MGILSSTPPPRDDWVGTRWSLVARLDGRDDPAWEMSWYSLVDAYRAPMERYARRVLSRRTGRPASMEEAADIVQEFLTTCVEKDWLSRADPLRGRFRAYLQVLLRRYVQRVVKHRNALRRSPGKGRRVDRLLDDEANVPAAPEDQADLDDFAKGWVQIAVNRALDRLAVEHERYRVVLLDLIHTDGQGSDDLAERVGLRQEQLAVLKHRARVRFSKLFESELADTVGDQEAFEQEWRAVRPYLPRGL